MCVCVHVPECTHTEVKIIGNVQVYTCVICAALCEDVSSTTHTPMCTFTHAVDVHTPAVFHLLVPVNLMFSCVVPNTEQYILHKPFIEPPAARHKHIK